MANVKPVSLAEKLTLRTDQPGPRVVGTYNGHDLIRVLVEGEIHSPVPPGADAYYHVVTGVLDILIAGEVITLRAGDMHVMAARVAHRAVARGPCEVLVLAPPVMAPAGWA